MFVILPVYLPVKQAKLNCVIYDWNLKEQNCKENEAYHKLMRMERSCGQMEPAVTSGILPVAWPEFITLYIYVLCTSLNVDSIS